MCEGCADLRGKLKAALLDLENTQTDVLAKNRQIKRLKEQLAEQRKSDPLMMDAREVFEYWVAKCRSGPHHHPDRVLWGPKRQAAVLNILKLGASPARIKRAIDGAALDPFIDRQSGKVHDELELICRNEVKLADFIDRADRAERRGLNLSVTELWERLSNAVGQGIRSDDLDAYRFACPICRQPEELFVRPPYRPLVLVVKSTGLKVRCDRCNADETKLRAELARRKREEQVLLARMREEVAA